MGAYLGGLEPSIVASQEKQVEASSSFGYPQFGHLILLPSKERRTWGALYFFWPVGTTGFISDILSRFVEMIADDHQDSNRHTYENVYVRPSLSLAMVLRWQTMLRS
jgi:hypothetical protein